LPHDFGLTVGLLKLFLNAIGLVQSYIKMTLQFLARAKGNVKKPTFVLKGIATMRLPC